MKPDEKKLERWIKALLRGGSVSAQDLLFHWNGLGSRGTRVLIAGLNKWHGWGVFFAWSNDHPDVKAHLNSLVDEAGITEEAFEYFLAAGIRESDHDTPRKKALRIRNAALDKSRQEWNEAFRMLKDNPELLEGTLPLLEDTRSVSAATFLAEWTKRELTGEADRMVRKVLYRLRQQGIEPQREEPDVPGLTLSPAEFFVFGENIIPRWQPVFYFHSESPFSQTGDLYFLLIDEGQQFSISEQNRNVKMNLRSMKNLASHYSASLQEDLKLTIPFRTVPAEEARWFLRRSCELLKGTSSESKMKDFLNLMPALDDSDPLPEMRSLDPSITSAEVKELLAERYFAPWSVTFQEMEPHLQRIEEVEKGPIILPEGEIRERKQAAFRNSLRDYFQDRTKRTWAFAFEKAAWFLKDSDRRSADQAIRCAMSLMASTEDTDLNPVAWELFSRSLEYGKERQKEVQKEEKRTSLIMTPQEFQRLHSKE